MGSWSAWIMAFFLFGGVRYALGLFLTGGTVAETVLLNIIPLVSGLLIIALAPRLFLSRGKK